MAEPAPTLSRLRSARDTVRYHLDNLFYASSLGDVPFAVVDWQALSLGVGVQDVGFFMCRSFSPAERREGEMDLLRLYHDTLVEDGVEGYTFEETLNDYRFTALEGLLRMVIMAGAGMSPEKERVYREILLPRCCAAVLDHDAGALLP